MRKILRPDDDGVEAYQLLNSLVVPRPIAWVSSLSEDGVGNLAPHSFFTVVCVDPPMVAFASVGEKDTARNIRATREFVVNVATRSMLDAVNNSAATFDHTQDEAAILGITMEPSQTVVTPRVAAAPAAMECTLHSMVELGNSILVIGQVSAFAVDPGIMDGDHPTMQGLAPLSRMGLDEWGLPPDVIRRERPGDPSTMQS